VCQLSLGLILRSREEVKTDDTESWDRAAAPEKAGKKLGLRAKKNGRFKRLGHWEFVCRPF
jgi:hypothetical protein